MADNITHQALTALNQNGLKVIKYKATYEDDEYEPNYGGGDLDISVTDGVIDLIHDEDAFMDAMVRAVISRRDENGFGCSIRQLRGLKNFWVGQLTIPVMFSYSIFFLENYVFGTQIDVGFFDMWQSRTGQIHIEVGLAVDQTRKITV